MKTWSRTRRALTAACLGLITAISLPDAAQAIPFWTSVANTFKGNDAVIFDLFNEPYASRATGSTTTGWQCWLSGGTCAGISYQVAGMQSMVSAVRSTGATNANNLNLCECLYSRLNNLRHMSLTNLSS